MNHTVSTASDARARKSAATHGACPAAEQPTKESAALQHEPVTTTTRILRLPQVLALVGLRRSTVYNHIQNGVFPKPIKLGRASGWIQAEVQAWIQSQIDASRRG